MSLRVSFIARVTSYEIFLLHEFRVICWIRVTSYCLLHDLRITFTSYVLLFIAQVMSYFYCTSCELLFCTSCELLFICELRFVINRTSYELLSYSELQYKDNPAGMRRLWDISIRSPLRETSQRHLRDISKKTSFLRRLWDISNTSQKIRLSCDIFEMSQMHLKKDVFCETFLRRLAYISKKTSFTRRLWDVSNTSQKRCLLCDALKMSQIHHIKDALCDVFKMSQIHIKKDVF